MRGTMAYVHENFRERFNAGEEAFQINQFIAQGGQAWVFGATDKQSGDQEVALKVFPGFMHNNRASVDVFEDEYTHLRELNHFDNIVTVFGTKTFEDEGEINPYLIMELADGSIADIEQSGSLTTHAAVPLLRDAMTGMAAAHSKDILHCDLKPSNLLVKNGDVKVADFGIAINRSKDTHTVTHDAKGTLPYMPVEQFEGKPRKASDVYAMGVIAYKLLTGHLPREPIGVAEPNAVQWYQVHKKGIETVPRFRSQQPNKVADAIEVPIRAALERNHKRRFPDMGEFKDAFSEAAARGLEQQKKQRVIIDPKPVEKTTPKAQPLKTRPYEEARDGGGAKPKAKVVEAKPAPHPNPTRRTFLRAAGGAALAGGVMLLTNREQVEDWFTHNFGASDDELAAARVQLLTTMFGKLTNDSAKSGVAKALATNHGAEALKLLPQIKDPVEASAVWPSLALQFPTKTIDAVKAYTAQQQYNAATNAAMGLALHANSSVPAADRDRSIAAINELADTLRVEITGNRQVSLLAATAQQSGTLQSYGYSSTSFGKRLLEYGKDPNATYEVVQAAAATAVSGTGALREAAHGMLDYCKTPSVKGDVLANALSSMSTIAARLSQYSPQEGLVVAKRIMTELPVTAQWAIQDVAPGIAAKNPLGLKDVLDLYPNSGSALFAMGAIAGYSPAHVETAADKFTDGSSDKTWLDALADPTDQARIDAALATMTNEEGKVPANKINVWTAHTIAQMAMANTSYQKNATNI
jgi:serine/threonine protein kinase